MARINNKMKASPKAKTINIAWGTTSREETFDKAHKDWKNNPTSDNKKKESPSSTFIKNKLKKPWAR